MTLTSEEPPPTSVDISTLTPRQRQVFDLLVMGFSNKEIAAKLYLSVRSVESYVGEIYSKTRLTRIRLIAQFRQLSTLSGTRP